MNYSKNAMKIYEALYLSKILGEKTPHDCHLRVSKIIGDDIEEKMKFLSILDKNIFRPNTPCLINAGIKEKGDYNNQLCACFVINLEDSMKSIINLWETCSLIYASGGGAGFRITALREKGSPLSSGGVASGPLAYLKVCETVSNTVKSGGRHRRAANLGAYDYNHPDVYEITNIKQSNELQSFNLSMIVDNWFMNRVVKGEEFEIETKSPNKLVEKENKIKGHELWKNVIHNAWASGDPGILFIETINATNTIPSIPITCTNPCLVGDTLLFDNDRLQEIRDQGNIFKSWMTGIKKVIELTLSNGKKLQLTPEHIIQDKYGNDIKAINSLNLEINDILVDRYYDGPVLSYHNIELLGFLYGDGFFCGGGHGISVKINIKKEPDIYKFLIKKGFHKQDNGALYISAYELADSIPFMDIITQNCSNKIIPKAIMTENVNFISSFLRGLYSANGSVVQGQGKRVSFKTISKKLAEQIQILHSLFGINSYITTNRPNEIEWENGVYTSVESYNVEISSLSALKRFKKYIGFLETIKNEKLMEIISNKKSNGERKKFPKVRSIEALEIPRAVYDFKMHNGTPYNNANGIIVHNCGEIPLMPDSTCVIGSINVSKFITMDVNPDDNCFDYEEFEHAVKLGTKFLDNIIDRTSFINDKFKYNMLTYRPIGLGIMGFADLLVQLNIEYGSPESFNIFKNICKRLTLTAIRTSLDIVGNNAATPANIPDCDKEAFIEILKYYGCNNHNIEQYKQFGIRNTNWTCIAPTGSISISADCSYSFEPLTAIVWQKELAESHTILNFINPEFEKWMMSQYEKKPYTVNRKQELIQEIIENKGSIQGINWIPENIQKRFKTMHDIDPLKKIEMQSVGQRYISMAISSTCNLPNSATEKDVEDIYIAAWRAGLKGITVYRDGCKEWQPINFGSKKDKAINNEKKESQNISVINHHVTTDKIKRPRRRSGECFELPTPKGKFYITLTKTEEGKPLEVWLSLGEHGSHENLLYDTIARLLSTNLQRGVPVKDLISTLRKSKEDKFWFSTFLNTSEEIHAAESTIDALAIIMEEYFIKENGTIVKFFPDKIVEQISDPCEEECLKKSTKCPKCGNYTLEFGTGCRGGQCSECGFSNCS